MTRGWRWAIEGGSGLVLAVAGYLAGGDSGGSSGQPRNPVVDAPYNRL